MSNFFWVLFFGFLTGVRVAEMGIEILIQDFRGLLVEVSSLPPSREGRMGNKRKRKGNEHQGSRNRMQI